jgi:NAD(P)H-hydrate epimerase
MADAPLYTAAEMRAAEERYPGYPDTVPELMERAGGRAAELGLALWPEAQRWTVVCGGGSNGGDGRVLAERLVAAGREATVVDAKAGETDLGKPDVLVDALFGTGFSGEQRPDAAALIDAINASGAPVFSIDLPSGVDASTGEIAGAAVEADATVTFHGTKLGLAVAPGRYRAGDVHVADIGLDPAATEHRLVTPAILDDVPRRRSGDNKYTAGHVLVVGGSPGMTGAPSLSARAALRADAGYVTIAAPAGSLPVLETLVVEAVKRPLEQAFEAAEKATALAVGPGLGCEPEAKELVRRLLAEVAVPAVVDADALFELEPGDWPAPRVLTPHEGELGRLLGRASKEIAAHRLASVQEAAETFRAVVVLKGEDTLVAAPGAGVLVVALGLPSLATAGTGDVLTGILGAFLAKGMEPQRAAAAAAAAQQLAAHAAPQRAGLVASDLIDALPGVLGGA